MATLALCAVLIPLAVSIAAVARREWHPSSDVALELFQVNEVGGSRTPLTGAWSKWGWDHPGPMLFWILAPFTWLFGTNGALIGTIVINGAAMAGGVFVARRRGGDPLAVWSASLLLLLGIGLGPEHLFDPWNPWVAVLPFFPFLLLAWSVGEGDLAMAPYFVVAGSFLVQTHVGYAPLVAGMGLFALVMAISTLRRSRSRPPGGSHWRSLTLAVVVGALLWLPPVVQQLTSDDGNLAALIRYSANPPEASAGWETAWGVMGAQLNLPGGWLRGEPTAFAPVGSVIPAVLLLTATAILGWFAARRGTPPAGRLAVAAIVAALLGAATTARVSGAVYTYVVRWWCVIAVMVWLSLLWSAWSLLKRARVRTTVTWTSLASAGLLALVLGWRAVPAELPDENASEAIARLSPQVAGRLAPDGVYLVDSFDLRGWGSTGIGLMFDLDQRGFNVFFRVGADLAFEPWQTARPEDADATILLIGEDDAARGVVPPIGASLVAQHDPLSPDERARAKQLRDEIDAALAPISELDASAVDQALFRDWFAADGVPKAGMDELADLRSRGPAFRVYFVPHHAR